MAAVGALLVLSVACAGLAILLYLLAAGNPDMAWAIWSAGALVLLGVVLSLALPLGLLALAALRRQVRGRG